MANKEGRIGNKYRQTHYRPRYYKALKIGAWAMILMLALCMWAGVAG